MNVLLLSISFNLVLVVVFPFQKLNDFSWIKRKGFDFFFLSLVISLEHHKSIFKDLSLLFVFLLNYQVEVLFGGDHSKEMK